MQQVFSTPKCMKKDFRFTYCPGCDHGVATRLVAELIDEFDLREKTISSTCVGCSVFLYNFINIVQNSSFQQAAKNTATFSIIAVPLAVILSL